MAIALTAASLGVVVGPVNIAVPDVARVLLARLTSGVPTTSDFQACGVTVVAALDKAAADIFGE